MKGLMWWQGRKGKGLKGGVGMGWEEREEESEKGREGKKYVGGGVKRSLAMEERNYDRKGRQGKRRRLGREGEEGR